MPPTSTLVLPMDDAADAGPVAAGGGKSAAGDVERRRRGLVTERAGPSHATVCCTTRLLRRRRLRFYRRPRPPTGPASAASSIGQHKVLVGGMPVLLAYRRSRGPAADGHADDDRLGGTTKVMAQ